MQEILQSKKFRKELTFPFILSALKDQEDLGRGHLTNVLHHEVLVVIDGKARKINIAETNKFHYKPFMHCINHTVYHLLIHRYIRP